MCTSEVGFGEVMRVPVRGEGFQAGANFSIIPGHWSKTSPWEFQAVSSVFLFLFAKTMVAWIFDS